MKIVPVKCPKLNIRWNEGSDKPVSVEALVGLAILVLKYIMVLVNDILCSNTINPYCCLR